jgi:hypothetical protein
VAISVVVPLFTLAVVGLTVFLIWKRRKGASQTQPTIGEYHKAELPVEGNAKKPVRAELSGSGVESGSASASSVHELANDRGG